VVIRSESLLSLYVVRNKKCMEIFEAAEEEHRYSRARSLAVGLVGSILWLGWAFRLWYRHGSFDFRGDPIGGDFVTFFAAGRAIILGESARLYHEDFMRGLQSSILHGDVGGYLFFFNPPQLALLFAPLSLLPYLTAFSLWTCINLVALGQSLRLLNLQGWRNFLAALSWYPVFTAYSFGQTSIISLWITSACIFAWRRGKSHQAGFLLSFLFYKLYLAVLLLVFFLGEGVAGRRALGGFCLGIALWTAFGLLTVPTACQEFIEVARTLVNRQEFWFLHPAECSLDSLWFRLSAGSIWMTKSLSWIARLVVLAAYGFISFRRIGAAQVRCAFAVLLGLLLFPHSMIYELALLLVPFGLLWQVESYRQVLAAWGPVVWAFGLIGPLSSVWQQPLLPFGINVTAALLLGMAIIGLYWEIRSFNETGEHAVS
jgi:alpha-1,2-mannosyltransferase